MAMVVSQVRIWWESRNHRKGAAREGLLQRRGYTSSSAENPCTQTTCKHISASRPDHVVSVVSGCYSVLGFV